MSDLSFLIQTQNQVVIDQSFLQKCQQNNQTSDIKKTVSGLTKVLSSKQIKLNKNKTHLGLNKQSSIQKSIANLFTTSKSNDADLLKPSETQQIERDKKQLSKISMRIDALQQNQKRMQKRIGVEFFQIREDIQKRSKQQNQQYEQIKRIKNDLNDTKRNIGQLLAMITKRK